MDHLFSSTNTNIFFRTIDTLFDLLNSRHRFAKGYKGVLQIENKEVWKPFLEETFTYLMGLKDCSGKPAYKSPRKVGFIGFLMAIKSVQGIFNDYIEAQGAPLEYLLTYKLSQDHLELFFCSTRQANGFNNNPTASQFIATYKRLLLRNFIKGTSGNVKSLDRTDILHIFQDVAAVGDAKVTLSEAALMKKYDLEPREPCDFNLGLSDVPDFVRLPEELTEYHRAIIPYIAGYAGRMSCKQILCPKCCIAAGSTYSPILNSFIASKDNGFLFKPTDSVIRICEDTEIKIGRLLNCNGGELPEGNSHVYHDFTLY